LGSPNELPKVFVRISCPLKNGHKLFGSPGWNRKSESGSTGALMHRQLLQGLDFPGFNIWRLLSHRVSCYATTMSTKTANYRVPKDPMVKPEERVNAVRIGRGTF